MSENEKRQVTVLDYFFEVDDEVELLQADKKTYKKKKVLNNAFIFSCHASLSMMLEAYKSFEGFVSALCDGTYKLWYGGWVLVVVGTHTVVFDKKQNKAVHRFVVWGYMFCKSETAFAYERLFFALREYCMDYFDFPLVIKYGVSDRAPAIRKGFFRAWPEVKLANDWPHISREVQARSKGVVVNGVDKYLTIDAETIHMCRTKAQAHACAEVVLSSWEKMGGKAETVAAWFREEYCSEKFLNWFASVFGEGGRGILPHDQHLERFNLDTKEAIWGRDNLRGSTCFVLNTAIPKLVFNNALDMAHPSLTRHCDIITQEQLDKALLLVSNPNHYLIQEDKDNNVIHIYFNASFHNDLKKKVTAKRVAGYKAGLEGKTFKNVKDVATYVATHMSLHVITATPPEWGDWNDDFKHWDYACDCKAFTGVQTCSHEGAAHHLHSVQSLHTLKADIPKNKVTGRKRDVGDALTREDALTSKKAKKN